MIIMIPAGVVCCERLACLLYDIVRLVTSGPAGFGPSVGRCEGIIL